MASAEPAPYQSCHPCGSGGSDILPLARHLLARIAARHRWRDPRISAEGEARLLSQAWPGNVRELAHELERGVIFDAGAPLDFAHLGAASAVPAASRRNPAWRLPESGFSLDRVVDEFIAEALRGTEQNVSAAARRLGVTRDFLRYQMAQNKPEPSV